jgi:heme/copper-type cytochrome/quinol oxidase subunit 3
VVSSQTTTTNQPSTTNNQLLYCYENPEITQNSHLCNECDRTHYSMGSYFLVGQAIEWKGLEFGFTSGAFGGMFYLLTGFHSLHVLTGILLQLIILVRSFIPGNFESGHFGVNATSLFWHFVDVIWIVLFVLLYIWQ